MLDRTAGCARNSVSVLRVMNAKGGMMRWLQKISVLILLSAFWCPAGVAAADLDGNPGVNLGPGAKESRFANITEERFQMECDYLDIGGKRKDEVRLLYESLLKSRENVIVSRDQGELTRLESIDKLNRLDLDYYRNLRTSVKGKRNLERLERMIAKAGARVGDEDGQMQNGIHAEGGFR